MRGRPVRPRTIIIAWLLIFFPWLPGFPLRIWLPSMPLAWIIDANQAGEYALVAFSLVLLTGWVGQISLGQGSFVGIGAFTTGLVVRSLSIPFPANLPIVAVVSAAVAALLGLVALRVRGLYLAVATLIFAWMCDAYLFTQSWFVGSGGASSVPNRPIGKPGSITVFDLSDRRVFYLVTLATVAGAWYALVNLRDSKTGRAFFAVRGSEMAAVSLGIDVARYKLLAFAISGGMAGIAGNLIMTNRGATPVVFQFTVSLFYLSVAVIGGLGSLGGGVAAAVMFSALNEVFYRVPALDGWFDIVSVGLLLVVLLGYPGGFGALGPAIVRRFAAVKSFATRTIDRRRAARAEKIDAPPGVDGRDAEIAIEPIESTTEEPGVDAEAANALLSPKQGHRPLRLPVPSPFRRSPKVARRSINLAQLAEDYLEPTAEELDFLTTSAATRDWRRADVKGFELPSNRADRAPVLEADGIMVQFGGLTAVNNVSLAVREHEIVGLIGPNGAGKTTTFNAIAGLNEPTSGTVRIFGDDATRAPVHIRAQMGVGRTFQLIQLFPQLTVFDNLLVATHVHNDTGVFAHVVLTGKAIEAERRARERVRLVVALLGLEEVADRQIAGLPFGLLRQVEIARALVTESPLLMLDEPASGLDNAETDELAQLLYFVRAELGVSILLIEHDIRMVTSVSDYMYVINRGTPLAEGTPAEIQRNPEVIAAYLGQAEGSVELEPA